MRLGLCPLSLSVCCDNRTFSRIYTTPYMLRLKKFESLAAGVTLSNSPLASAVITEGVADMGGNCRLCRLLSETSRGCSDLRGYTVCAGSVLTRQVRFIIYDARCPSVVNRWPAKAGRLLALQLNLSLYCLCQLYNCRLSPVVGNNRCTERSTKSGIGLSCPVRNIVELQSYSVVVALFHTCSSYTLTAVDVHRSRPRRRRREKYHTRESDVTKDFQILPFILLSSEIRPKPSWYRQKAQFAI